MGDDRTRWLQELGEGFMKRIGVRQGQTVVDFGCNNGNYAIPAARVVGPRGKVYALDKNLDALRQLARAISAHGLSNIVPVRLAADQQIPLRDCSVDVALLYDVLHRGYLPEAAQRERLLQRIYHVVRPGGRLSFYPTHMRKYGLTAGQLIGEIQKAGFKLREERSRRLIHDGSLVRGRVFSFTRDHPDKKTRNRQAAEKC